MFPGRLSVSRTFGDIEAKLPRFGGNPRVIVAEPEIMSFSITNAHDFIVLGCDGIYDKLTSKDTLRASLDIIADTKSPSNIHEFCGKAAENILKESFVKRTLDNVTVVIIAFKNLK